MKNPICFYCGSDIKGVQLCSDLSENGEWALSEYTACQTEEQAKVIIAKEQRSQQRITRIMRARGTR